MMESFEGKPTMLSILDSQNKSMGGLWYGLSMKAGLAAVGHEVFASDCPPLAPALHQYETEGQTESSGVCSPRGEKDSSEAKAMESNDSPNDQLHKVIATEDISRLHDESLACTTGEGLNVPFVATTSGHNRRNKNQYPWILHFTQDLVRPEPLDAKPNGLRSSVVEYKLGQVVKKMDPRTYAKVCNASAFTLLKLIHQTLQNVTVHKRSCDELVHYLRAIDDLIAIHRSQGTASTDDLTRVLASLQEKLLVIYILVKGCESRSPHNNPFLDKIPSKISLVQGELQRIMPVLHRAILQQSLHSNLLPIVRGCTLSTGNACTATASPDASRHRPSVKSSTASAEENCISHVPTTNGAGRADESRQPVECSSISAQCLWSDRSSMKDPLRKTHMNVTPRLPDLHKLRFLRRPTKVYLCRACNNLGVGCVYYCERCDYGVHPECLELNEARQRLEEVSVTGTSKARSRLSTLLA